jgi:thiamine pyrophosphokinase
MIKKFLKSYKSIIFLNGTLPSFEFLKKLKLNVLKIAADGAYDKMSSQNIIPDIVIGDRDSSIMPWKENGSSIKYIYEKDQNSTDFEKCIKFAKSSNLCPSLVLGINGGEIDHILANAKTFLKYSQKNKAENLFFLDTYFLNSKENSLKKYGVKFGMVLNNSKSKYIFNDLFPNELISFIGNNFTISTKGLRWELLNQRFSNNSSLPIRNENLSKTVEIEVHKGKVLAIFDITKFFY